MDAQRTNHYRYFLHVALRTVFCCAGLATCLFAQESSRNPGASGSLLDATLHDCAMLSIDRAFAVGDAGSILLTEDGGKEWKSLSTARSEFNYYAIGMDNPATSNSPRSGLIVGGTVMPATGRSIGVVLLTQDDGKSWTPSAFPGLPRLIGLQRIKHRHWIAWGDWSDHHGSALFESIDGGKSWSPRPIPCGHLQSVSVSQDGAVLIVDRTSRVFFAANGIEFSAANIPNDPFRPIRFSKITPQGWWMGGDAAQLWHSPDGQAWQSVPLPVDRQDTHLVDCLQMEASGQRLWIVGKPANAIWMSDDQGATWSKQSTGATTVFNAIDAWNDQVLISCGRLGNIHQSRNGGQSWRQTHASAKRYLGLSLSATDQTIPWDAHAYIANEGLHHTAAVILHDRRFSEELHRQIDRASALECLASRARLDHVTTLRGLPISDLPTGSKVNDLAYYQRSSDQLLRTMVQEIRLHRPDVVIVEDSGSANMLRSACGSLASQAIQLAGNPSYMPSKSLGQDQPSPWTVQRAIEFNENGNGFSLSPSMVLKKSNQLLAKPLQPIRYYYAAVASLVGDQPPIALIGQAHYKLANQLSNTIGNPLDGLVLQSDTKLCDKPVLKIKLATLMSSANSASRVSELLQTRGSEVYKENAWEEALADMVKPLSPESALDVLWMVSQESRKQGNWHRWYCSLQMILARYPNQEQQQMAYRELMTYIGSAEIERMIRDQLARINQQEDIGKSAQAPSTGAISPFASKESSVKPASFTSEARLTPIARSANEKEFAKLLGAWPEDWRTIQSEPAWAWLISSRFRTSSFTRSGQLDKASEREFWPPYFPQVGNWSGIYEQEQIVNAPPEGALPIPRIPWTASRPHLDGIAEPEFWGQAVSLRLSTAWADETNTSVVRFCRDEEFLFIHMSSPRHRTSELAASQSPTKKGLKARENKGKRDSLDPQLDHVRLRIDIDRDYATWFEFAWDSQGGLLDRCNDIALWDPQWYIILQTSEDTWNAELAIPLTELISESNVPWEKLPWALSIQRERPSLSTEFLVAGDNDRWACDQWLIMNPAQP